MAPKTPNGSQALAEAASLDGESAESIAVESGLTDRELTAVADLLAAGASSPVRDDDSNRRVTAYDAVTGEKLPYPVPETHLDGRFPNLKETPSSKAGKS